MPPQNPSGPAAPAIPAKDYSALYLPVSILIAGALIAVGLFFGLSGKSASTGTPATPQPQAVNVKDVKTDGEPFIGKKDAPVTMAYWFDYQCPFCKAVDVGGIPQIPVTPAFPTLIKDYVNTGKLRIVFKDYPFLGNDSVTAAMYEMRFGNCIRTNSTHGMRPCLRHKTTRETKDSAMKKVFLRS